MNSDTPYLNSHTELKSHAEKLTGYLLPELPPALDGLLELATDLRWTWSHAADSLWQQIDSELWEKTQNPYVLLQNVRHSHLLALAENPAFCRQLQEVVADREAYLHRCGWYGEQYPPGTIERIAFFSMEYGLGGALPFYAGGLGILSGDMLKTASDLCAPMVAVGLLYREGYFRQILDASGHQQQIYTSHDPATLPLKPVYTAAGDWLKVTVDLPGRELILQVWMVQVGSVDLYLLDSNHPLNSPADRGITNQLYSSGQELRFLQQLVLGIGGWHALEAMGMEVDVCHLNEGHAAFVVLARTYSLMRRLGLPFHQAQWISSAGTLFTSHTPVSAAFDTYPPELVAQYVAPYVEQLNIDIDELLALGRQYPDDSHEPFNMAWFAMRGSQQVNAVSELHGHTSRELFHELYPRWPAAEIPVSHVTNGIHMPSWDSAWADRLWTGAAGKDRWRGGIEALGDAIEQLSDRELWNCRLRERQDLIHYVRRRHSLELSQRGADRDTVDRAERVLDPNILTLGFARRFTEYKRPTLLLMDQQRLQALLLNPTHPVQILVAGKAHGSDAQGKAMVQDWVEFAQRPECSGRVIFLEDYDIPLAREMVQGVDLWINTPRRPWEACGTSGMKVLVNGGLNLSVPDGWWAEAQDDRYGWTVKSNSSSDAEVSADLFRLLEEQVVPTFYQRDENGLPLEWIKRIRASMADLAPRFSSNRMLRDYIDQLYVDIAAHYRRRLGEDGKLACELYDWHRSTHRYWNELRWGEKHIADTAEGFSVEVEIYLDGLSPEVVALQLYAEAFGDEPQQVIEMQLLRSIPGAIDSYVYAAEVNSSRPPQHFTPRVIARHQEALVPQENALISWWQS